MLGDDGDSDSKPVPSKKSTKKKKKPVSDLDNEVDAALSDDDDDDSQTRPAGSNNDDDESEEESGGILEILDGEFLVEIHNDSYYEHAPASFLNYSNRTRWIAV